MLLIVAVLQGACVCIAATDTATVPHRKSTSAGVFPITCGAQDSGKKKRTV